MDKQKTKVLRELILCTVLAHVLGWIVWYLVEFRAAIIPWLVSAALAFTTAIFYNIIRDHSR